MLLKCVNIMKVERMPIKKEDPDTMQNLVSDLEVLQ